MRNHAHINKVWLHKLFRTIAFGALLAVVGCASEPDVVYLNPEPVAPEPLGNVEYHTAVLAEELFESLPGTQQYRYAVAGFVPVDSLRYNPEHQHPLMLLGHQLAEGMITEANRRGFITQDYKTTRDIIINETSERVFSRDVSKLQGVQPVDFFISGTITEQQEGAIVNARIIHAQSKDVVASATKFFPGQLFWQREKVTTRGGQLIRTGS